MDPHYDGLLVLETRLNEFTSQRMYQGWLEKLASKGSATATNRRLVCWLIDASTPQRTADEDEAFAYFFNNCQAMSAEEFADECEEFVEANAWLPTESLDFFYRMFNPRPPGAPAETIQDYVDVIARLQGNPPHVAYVEGLKAMWTRVLTPIARASLKFSTGNEGDELV